MINGASFRSSSPDSESPQSGIAGKAMFDPIAVISAVETHTPPPDMATHGTKAHRPRAATVVMTLRRIGRRPTPKAIELPTRTAVKPTNAHGRSFEPPESIRADRCKMTRKSDYDGQTPNQRIQTT